MFDKFLIVIVGPTAVGKTALSIEIAKEFNTDIVSADSRQFFREMNIGTAKPGEEELKAIKHHFINSHSVKEDYNVGKYEREVLDLLDDLFKNKEAVILTGGSGLYIDAVCKGLDDLPQVNIQVRNDLNNIYKEKGLEEFQVMLKKHDPEYYKTVDLSNPQRIIRALEVSISSGFPYSSFRKKKTKHRKFKTIIIGLELPREELYERIDTRVDEMIGQGLIEEAKNLIQYKDYNTLQTVGYKELFDHFSGNIDLNKAIELIKQNTRNYAKRQLTWFRKDREIKWFHPEEKEKIIEYVKKEVRKKPH